MNKRTETTSRPAPPAVEPTPQQPGVLYEQATVARCQDDYRQAQASRAQSADSNRH